MKNKMEVSNPGTELPSATIGLMERQNQRWRYREGIIREAVENTGVSSVKKTNGEDYVKEERVQMQKASHIK